MIKLKDLLIERSDFQYIASELVKNYGLKSKVKFGTGKDYADYVPETDTIKLRKNYPNVRQFLITVLHEIGHALDAQKLGYKKFKKKYDQALLIDYILLLQYLLVLSNYYYKNCICIFALHQP